MLRNIKSMDSMCVKGKVFIFLASMLSLSAFGNTNLKEINFTQDNRGGRFVIKLTNELIDPPALKVQDSVIQLDFSNVQVLPRIEKWAGLKKELKISAYQYNNKNSRVKIAFPYSLEKNKELISVTIKNNLIRLNFPYKKNFKVVKKTFAAKKQKQTKTSQNKPKMTGKVNLPLDEKYLETLIVSDKKSEKTKDVFAKTKSTTDSTVMSDAKGESKFNFNTYIMKFVFFLSMIIIGFLLIVKFFKKGALSKSKLNLFSADPALIKVINTTYIAPKKSLMLIKVHEQLLLVSNSDNGINFLTEVKDQVGALKAGDSAVNGSNFDEMVQESNQEKTVLAEKKDIYESKTKFTDEIKRKFKSLKPLQ